MENRKCGYTCCACYSLSSYSQKRLPVKYPFTLQRTKIEDLSTTHKKKTLESVFFIIRGMQISHPQCLELRPLE